MEINKATIKAISVDSRLEIMKKLTQRRMLPSELSKRLGLAPSTVTEHLKKLESAGLVVKRETGHKWIYYELTDRGLGLVRPETNARFVLVLSLGAIFVFSSFVRLFQQATTYATAPLAGADTISEAARKVATPAIHMDFMFWGLLIVGIAFIASSLIIKFRK